MWQIKSIVIVISTWNIAQVQILNSWICKFQYLLTNVIR